MEVRFTFKNLEKAYDVCEKYYKYIQIVIHIQKKSDEVFFFSKTNPHQN